jgi:hypothetical protein
MFEQMGVVWRRRLIDQLSISFLLNLTAVCAPSQHAEDDVCRHPILFFASPVNRIAAPPQAALIVVRRLQTANSVNKMCEGHQPLLVLDQEHVIVQSKQRTMLMVSSIEETRVFVLKAAGDLAQAALSSLQRQMRLVLGDVTRVQSRFPLPQCRPQ